MQLNRRNFISQAGLATAALGLGLVSCRNPSQASSTAAANRPQPTPLVLGEPLRPPPQVAVQRSKNLAQVTLVAAPTTARIAGQQVQALTYNGSVPGPTVRVRAGETLRLTFHNRLAPAVSHDHQESLTHTTGASDTNLHLHGPHIAPATDQPLLILSPGMSRTIDLPLAESSAGTHWYHPHPHGQVAPQMLQGLTGSLIVEGELDQELQDWEEHLLILKDFTLKGGKIEEHQGSQLHIGKGGQLLTVNGQLQPVLHARKAGIWLRLLNQSTARPYLLQLEHQPLHLIATDGHTLEKAVQIEELLLAPGQRADVLVRLEGQRPLRLLALPYKAVTVSTDEQTTLLTIQPPSGTAPQLPTHLTTLERLKPASSLKTRPLLFTFQSGFMGTNYRFMINRQMFDHNRIDIQAKLDTQETWEIENRHSWDLPFHLHSYPFQVTERRINGNWTPEPFLAWRDTVNIDQGDSVRVLIPFRHYPGKTVYHCHIVEHEDTGMMGILNVQT